MPSPKVTRSDYPDLYGSTQLPALGKKNKKKKKKALTKKKKKDKVKE